MKKMLKTVRDYPYAIAASITITMMSTGNANATGNVGAAAENLSAQAGQVGRLMTAGAFVGGLVMLASGLMKLKQAAETQGQQVKYGEGMWRVGVGAGLVAIPAFGGMLTSTLSLGDVSITDGGGQSF